MNIKFNLIIILISVAFISCKKDSQVTGQTLQLIQKKWVLVSDKIALPTIPVHNSSYMGVATDYYLFDTNDSLTIHVRSLVSSYTQSTTDTYPYAVRSNSTLAYGPNLTFQVTIQKLTNDTLILTNPINSSFLNSGGTYTTYAGTRTVILSK